MSAAGPPSRSIPACAGEAPARPGGSPGAKVYPRVCGGSRYAAAIAIAAGGLSPRVRGKLAAGITQHIHMRSIPACAGEARWCTRRPAWGQVYPRVCGGSPAAAYDTGSAGGLSPRVRGKPTITAVGGESKGSIPACAGEAERFRCCSSDSRVYPRVCGGSSYKTPRQVPAIGLSPRVRGKPPPHPRRRGVHRSIPACAGEAVKQLTKQGYAEVYPRVCGGSIGNPAKINRTRGLSPRVRGKRCRRISRSPTPRSIPACAGEA